MPYNILSANINNNTIISENMNELLGAILDSTLSFEDDINSFFKKTSEKLNALATVSPYMCLDKRKTVMKAICNISVWILSFSLDVSWQSS